ncbi:putative ribonuclease H-like domain-containing protein [Tanacetum coccineum]
MTHPSPKRNIIPKVVLMRSGLVSITTTRPVNTAQPRITVKSARPMTNNFNKELLPVRRPINNKTSTKNSNFNQGVNTVKDKNVNTARPKVVVNTVKPKAVLNAIKGNQDQGVIDSGCSRHMTGNMSYLTDFEEIDGGYVAFGGNPKGGKITGRATKDETSGILKSFITGVENLIDQKVKVIRCDNGTEFRNKKMNQICKRKVTKPHKKTLYESFLGTKLALGFMRPFGCLVTIPNTIDHLGKFDGKADEGFFIGYSINGSGPNWLFDIDALTKSMNYKPIIAGNQSNSNVGTKACDDAWKARMVIVHGKDYILLPLWAADPPFSQNSKSSPDAGFKPSGDNEKKVTEEPRKEGGDSSNDQEKEDNVNNTNNVNAANINEVNAIGAKTSIELPYDPNMPELEDIVYSDDDEDVGVEADMNNLNTFMPVSLIPTMIIHKDHPFEQIIGDLNLAPQTRRMIKNLTDNGFEDLDFLDRVYKVEKVIYILHQAPRAWYETLSTYLLDNGFERGNKDKTLFIRRDKGDILLVQVYVDDIIFGSTKKSLCTEFEKMMHKKFQISSMGKLTFLLGLQVKQKNDGIFISQDKYVIENLKKFGFTDVKTASTPMETQKPLLKYEDGEEVDVHLYRSMIGSLMYLTFSRLDIMFAVCAYARYQVNPKVSHLHVVKQIFRYLKGQPKLGLWYPKDSPFDLVAYTDCDYARASLDKKSTTGGYQILRCRLISWQYKKQTVVANSTTKAEYVAASS